MKRRAHTKQAERTVATADQNNLQQLAPESRQGPELVQALRDAFRDKRRADCEVLLEQVLRSDPENSDALFIQLCMETERVRSKRKKLLAACILVVLIGPLVWYALPERAAADRTGADRTAVLPAAASSEPATANGASFGTLQVTIDPGVEIFINDMYAGTAPIAPLKLKPGAYDLHYKFEGSEIGTEKIAVGVGQLVANTERAFLGSVELLVLPATGTLMQVDRKPAVPVQSHLTLKPGQHHITFTAAGYQPETVAVSLAVGTSRNLPVILKPMTLGSAASSVPALPAAADSAPQANGTLAVSGRLPVDVFLDNRQIGTTPFTVELAPGTYTFEYRYGNSRKTVVNTIRSKEVTRASAEFDAASAQPIASATSAAANVPTGGTGTLAVSSPTPADLYVDGRYVGSTPMTLQMSAGLHAVEYRHGDQRQTLTHVITSNQTTKATITFDVAVQINAKPWANVFVDGVERKSLGQTPLSGVRVPIGAVLVFENPQFQAKKYRVTGKETGIQMVFP